MERRHQLRRRLVQHQSTTHDRRLDCRMVTLIMMLLKKTFGTLAILSVILPTLIVPLSVSAQVATAAISPAQAGPPQPVIDACRGLTSFYDISPRTPNAEGLYRCTSTFDSSFSAL